MVTHCVFFPCVIFNKIPFLFLSPHCWEGAVCKHFTVSLHLLFTENMTNKIRFEHLICFAGYFSCTPRGCLVNGNCVCVHAGAHTFLGVPSVCVNLCPRGCLCPNACVSIPRQTLVRCRKQHHAMTQTASGEIQREAAIGYIWNGLLLGFSLSPGDKSK